MRFHTIGFRPRKIFPVLLTCYALLGYSSVIFGQGETTPAIEDTKNSHATADKVFTSDGNPIRIDSLGIKVTPIAGWEVNTGGAISVVMQEPAPIEHKESEGPTFRRNITIAAIHKGLPIDSKRGESLKEELLEKFGKSVSISNFAIGETQFFDYKNSKDGIILYSDFSYKKFDMRQMHVLVGGEKNQLLLTYTDFRKNFEAKDSPLVAQAWQTMSTVQVDGTAPVRYQNLYNYGPVAVATLIFFFIVMILRSMKNKALLRRVIAEADQVEGDFEEFKSDTMWNLSSVSNTPNTQLNATNYSSFRSSISDIKGSHYEFSNF